MYAGTPQWEKAALYAHKVMHSGYELFDGASGTHSAYQMLFMGDNGENGAAVEAILPLLQDGRQTAAYGCSLFLIASTTEGATMPPAGTTECWAGNRARPHLVAKFFPSLDPPHGTAAQMVEAAGDDRALFFGRGRTLSILDPKHFAEGFSVTKFTNVYSTGRDPHSTKYADTDFFLMRAAEAWLTYAEATTRLNGGSPTPQGLEALNAVRARAHARPLASCTLSDILDEWSREFYFEGRRRTDLIRFGCYGGPTPYLWEWKGGVQKGASFASALNTFPIPHAETTANDLLHERK